MDLEATGIVGCYLLKAPVQTDLRGDFTKCFHQPEFAALGLRTDWTEEYFSASRRGVVRGMHFQTPPAAHAKTIFCVAGEVLDVVLDLRTDSPTYRQWRSFTLTRSLGLGIYLPEGLAHGFLSLSDESVILYRVTSVYAPEQDSGVLWNSFGFSWPVEAPLLSQRDTGFPRLDDFVSPFVLNGGR
jgi:dTDP-4-dehydrorhamnose 3,5-epimerase